MEPIDSPFVIKICGITDEEDARAAVEAGASPLSARTTFRTRISRSIRRRFTPPNTRAAIAAATSS